MPFDPYELPSACDRFFQLPLPTAAPNCRATDPAPPHEHASPAMKSKHSAAELKHLALEGAIAACEARAFAAFHGSTLDGHNHTEYVEASVLQLGGSMQHGTILTLLGSVQRDFRAGKIAYRPPNAGQLTSVLDVARWGSQRLEGGLAHAGLLDRVQRGALIKAGAAVDKTENQGMTALVWASFNGHLKCAQVLVNAGADKSVNSKFGTALSLARQNGHTTLCELLEA